MSGLDRKFQASVMACETTPGVLYRLGHTLTVCPDVIRNRLDRSTPIIALGNAEFLTPFGVITMDERRHVTDWKFFIE